MMDSFLMLAYVDGYHWLSFLTMFFWFSSLSSFLLLQRRNMDALFSPRSISAIGYVPGKEFRWLAAVFSGVFMCCAVYKITGLISLLCFDGYRKLKNMDKVEWKNRGFSTFHAIIASSASLYLLLFSDLFKDSHDRLVINRTSTVSETILGICAMPVLGKPHVHGSCSTSSKVCHSTLAEASIGYFMTDLAMILWHFPALGGWEYVLHHGLSMFSIFLSLISGQGQIYILMVLFSESTTPFVNLRWYLDIAGQKNSDLYVCNGIFLFLGWLVARILLFIFFFTHMLLHFDQVKEIFDLGFYSLLLVAPVLAVMNVFWFWKIAKGLVKTLSKNRHRQ